MWPAIVRRRLGEIRGHPESGLQRHPIAIQGFQGSQDRSHLPSS